MSNKSSRLTFRLLSLTAVVLIVPWLGIQSLSTMEEFLLEGQEQAQLITAQGIAALLSDRPALFADAPESVEGFAELPLYPSSGEKVIDGYADDWQSLQRFSQVFFQQGETPKFSLVMAEAGGMVFGLVNVEDETLVTRNPGLLRMDKSDHLRFYLKDKTGRDLRVLVAFEGNGAAIVYQMDEEWEFADPGTPEYRLKAYVQSSENGYDVEFRFPVEWLGPSRQMGLAVADVADPVTRDTAGITGTFPRLDEGTFNPVIIRSAEMEAVLQGFSQENARLWILDDSNRVKAIVGNLQGTENSDDEPDRAPPDTAWWQQLVQRVTGWLVGINASQFEDFDTATVQRRNDTIYRQALAGEPVIGRRQSLDNQAEIVTAAYPITAQDEVVGVLLLEKSTRHILQLQRQSLETLVGLTVVGMVAVSLLLLLFAYRLTWRIKRLGTDAALNVDEFGRFVGGRKIHGVKSRDEIGLLAKTIARMLDRLRQQINNPLNAISTSLDSIERGEDAAPYLDVARRGLGKIGHVVNSLAEAANLEQALKSEELVELDLAELLSLYVSHQSAQHSVPIALDVPSGKVQVLACGEHFEEALDKLLDNARDFSATDGRPIDVTLTVDGKEATVSVTNQGPQIPPEQITDLFQFMNSSRSDSEGQHFGLGLYIARVIVEHHQGHISAENLADGSGVRFTIGLPLVKM